MNRIFAPGCALSLYKPHLAAQLHAFLERHLGVSEMLLRCCINQPPLAAGVEVINVCPGCDRRFRENYCNSTTVSVWEILAESDSFVFPNYQGSTMTILDACPTREKARVHDAIRLLLKRMNITLVEPAQTRSKSICCGDSFWGTIPVERVKQQMGRRASQMPAEDVVVYCVSCVKAMRIGGKTPRYLVDLLFDEPTIPGTVEPAEWHPELDNYVASH